MNITSWIHQAPPPWFDWMAAIATLVALAFALLQLSRTRSAAEASRDAARRARDALAAFDSVAAIAELRRLLGEIRNYHDNETWTPLPDRYLRARQLVIEIRDSTSGLTANDRRHLQTMLTRLVKVSDRVEDGRANPLKLGEIAKLNKVVADQVDLLTEIAVRLRNQAGMA